MYVPTGNPLARIQAMLDSCDPKMNKHDRGIIFIHACLDEEINTRQHIVDTALPTGFKQQHIAILLNDHTGDDPRQFLWWRDERGIYSSHLED